MEQYAEDFKYFCLVCNFSYHPKIQAGVIMVICPLCKDTTHQELLQAEPP